VPSAAAVAEFVENFGRLPTEWEKQYSACDDCYALIIVADRCSSRN